MRLMIVDDDRQIREGIRYGIEWKTVGIDQIRDYPNGKAALKELKEYHPDIILADIRMPQMNGLEFLQEVRKRNQKVRFLILSAYSDFEYAREALRNGANDYELKPVRVERLIQMVEEQVRELRKLHIQEEREQLEARLTYSIQHSTEEENLPELICRLLKKEKSDRSMRILVLKIRAEYGGQQEGKKKAGKGLRDMAAYFSGLLLTAETGEEKEIYFGLCPGTVSVLQTYQQKVEIKNQIKDLNDRLRKEKVFLTVGISDGHSCSNVGRAWQEAGEALEESFYYGRGTVNFFGNERDNPIWEEGKTEKLCRDFLRAGEIPDRDGLKTAIGKLKRYAADAHPSRDQLKEFLMRIVHELTKSMDGYLSPEKMRSSWEQAEYLEEYIRTFEEYILEVADQKERQRHLDRFSPAVADTVKYLEKHFPEPVTIEKVAESLGKSANYLSSIFKRETGNSFTDYLLRLRMEEASRLLQNTSLPVKKVAEQVGYSDYVYFSKLFKKTFGCSASDCRNGRI